MTRTKLKDRILPDYTKGEEIFNMTSHIVGGSFGIVALVLCVVFAAIHHNGYGVVSSAIYGVMMIILYTMSSIYHGLKPERKAKKVFVFEEGMKSGGFAQAIASKIFEKGFSGKFSITAIEKFVAHSTVKEALTDLKLDSESIIKKVKGEA